VIRSFGDEETRRFWLTGQTRRFGKIAKAAVRKIQAIDFVSRIEDLRNPPGNRLEKLHGGREGQYSIRINDQYRVCFRWEDGHAWEVEIAGYH
jgi:proteic killer suppression protein